MWRRWDDRLYAALMTFWAGVVVRWRLVVPARAPLQPAPRVLVSVGATSAEDRGDGDVLEPPDPPAPTSSWAARPSHSKAWLACVLLGELQAGVMLRAMWEVVVRT